MHSITAEFSLNAPLFSSGAKPNEPELRVSEIKAALRFWWRAMNYSLYAADRSRFVDVESQLFGSARASCGQGVLLSLTPITEPGKKRHAPDVHEGFKNAPGARYLGYGLMVFADVRANSEKGTPAKFAGELTRSCIDPGWSFTVRLVWRDRKLRERTHADRTLTDHEFRGNLLRAIKAFGLFGGLGSRSRRGFGSVTLQDLVAEEEPSWTAPVDASSLRAAIRALLVHPHQLKTPTPEDVDYSAFTSHSRSTVISMNRGQRESGYHLLDAMGSAFVRYRAWGRNGRILNSEDANGLFEDDHNWFRGGPVRDGFEHPDRIVFGLPHPYDKTIIWGGDDVRRASPLLFHVHRASPSQHLGLIFDLRSRFLPEDKKLVDPISRKQVSASPDWTFLDDVLNGEVAFEGTQPPLKLFRDAACTGVFEGVS